MSGNRISFFRRNRLRVRKEASQKEQTSQVRFTLSRVEHETLTDEVTVETKFPRWSFKSRSTIWFYTAVAADWSTSRRLFDIAQSLSYFIFFHLFLFAGSLPAGNCSINSVTRTQCKWNFEELRNAFVKILCQTFPRDCVRDTSDQFSNYCCSRDFYELDTVRTRVNGIR